MTSSRKLEILLANVFMTQHIPLSEGQVKGELWGLKKVEEEMEEEGEGEEEGMKKATAGKGKRGAIKQVVEEEDEEIAEWRINFPLSSRFYEN